MLLLGADDGMKRKQGPRSDSFLTGTNLDNGIQKTRDLNSGIFSTDIRISENTSEYFLSATGQNLMYGSIFSARRLNCPVFIIPTGEKYSAAMEYILRGPPLCNLSPMRKFLRLMSVAGRSE